MLRIAEQFAGEWATCHIKHGAVLAVGNRIIASGYNGSLPGEDHCLDVGCEMRRGHCVRTIHAEINAISWARKMGFNEFPRTTLYVTGSPCPDCQEAIRTFRIPRVVYRTAYRGVLPKEAGVEWVEWGWGNAHPLHIVKGATVGEVHEA